MLAYLTIDPDDDTEGACAFQHNGVWFPMVGADAVRMRSYRSMAEQIARETGQKVKLVRFSVREELEEIDPHGT